MIVARSGRSAFVATLLPMLTATVAAQVNWSQVSGAGAPMAYGGFAWDGARARLVAFGGEASGVPSDQQREFNPTSLSWATINPATRPSPRRRPAMAFDEARGVCVMFGGGAGTGGNTFLNETWTWDGTNWTQRFPTTVPGPRFGAAMAYDSLRQVVVMHGGFVQSGLDTGDLWEWNGTDWTQRTPAGGPSARGAHRMVFDATRGFTLLYGGYSTPGQTTLADTWIWDGNSWTAGPGGPGSLCDQLFVHDSHRQRVVLFGGLRITGPSLIDLNATWEWNGIAWTPRTTATPPSGRSSMACGFDPVSGRILSGGGGTSGGTQFGTTFALRPTSPATVTSFGTGCPTTGGPVQLNALSMPYVGGAFEHQIAGGPPLGFVGLLAFGGSNTTWNGLPLPLDLTVLGAPGCQALVSPDVLLTVLLNAGAGSVTWNLPNVPSFVGQSFFTQAVILDPQSPLAFQIGASSGRQFTIGAP